MPCASTGISLLVRGRRLLMACRAGSAATGRRRRHRSGRPSCPICASAIARLAETVDLPTPPLPLPIAIRVRDGWPAVIAMRASATPGTCERGRRAAPLRALRAPRRDSPVASAMMVATPPLELARADPLVVRQVGRAGRRDGPWAAHRKRAAACHCFSCASASIIAGDEHHIGVGRPRSRPLRRQQGPLGPSNGGAGGPEPASEGSQDGEPSQGPWGETSASGAVRRSGRARMSRSLDELFAQACARFGGGGGGLPGRPGSVADRSGPSLAVVLIWLVFTGDALDRAGPARRRHPLRPLQPARLGPGVGLTLPAPIDRVKKIDVENIRTDRPRLARAATT